MTSRKFIDLTVGNGRAFSHAVSRPDPMHHNNPVVITGEGSVDYQFPTVEELVKRCVKSGSGIGGGKRRRRRNKGRTIVSDSPVKSAIDLGGRGFFEKLRVAPAVPAESDESEGKTMVAGAEGLQFLMAKRQFDGLLERRFGEIAGAVTWAQKNMEAKFQPAIKSLSGQLDVLQDRYKEALPMLVQELAKRNPGVPVPELFQHAIQMLDQELAPILFTLKVYSDCFGQYRDGRFAKELDAISTYFKDAHSLMAEGVPTTSFHVGDHYLARFTSMGLATIPGSKGPIGIHALQVPFNMQDMLVLMFPLLAHEFRHNIFHDVVGMEEELQMALKNRLVDGHTKGEFKLSAEKIKLSRKVSVSALDLLIKLVTDGIGEEDADIVGGAQLSGPSYMFNMLLSFPAMLINDGPISEAEAIFRTSSVYQLVDQEDGSKALVFEPHPPDYARIYIGAAALEAMGFPEAAAKVRRLADFGMGDKIPEFLTYTDAEEKSEMVIRIPIADVKAIAPAIADALINTKLECLGGRSTSEVVCWTQAREVKVQLLVDNLVAGSSEVPEDKGTMFATFVGSAATMAFWRLVENGTDAVEAVHQVSKLGLEMIQTIKARAAKS